MNPLLNKNYLFPAYLQVAISHYLQKMFRPIIDQECLILQKGGLDNVSRQHFLSPIPLTQVGPPARPAFLTHLQSGNSFHHDL